MISLTPTQTELLGSDQVRLGLGDAVADEVSDAIEDGGRDEQGMTIAELEPWRDALSAVLRQVGPDSVDPTTMEAADNLVKQLGEQGRDGFDDRPRPRG